MKLRLKEYGTIEITTATLVDGGDIMLEAADHFEGLAKTTGYKITEVLLTDTEYGWSIIAFLDLPENNWYDDDFIMLNLEDPEEIYKLNAFL